MIFTIVLAEDEPAAMRHLKSIIEKRAPGFRVIAVAEDGQEALEKIMETRPDVLITDIRMPRSNGLQLVQKVKDHNPEIQTIILSGYQEFDYARQAIQQNVVEYLLKPVNIQQFEVLMSKVYSRLSQKLYWKTHKRIQKCLSSKGNEIIHDSEKLFFRIVVIRINGLHPKFHKKVSYNPPESVRYLLHEQITTEEIKSLFLFTGRDNNEYYILCPKCELHYSRFRTIIEDFSQKIPGCRYYTAALALDIRLNELAEALDRLYSLLRERTRLGVSQILYDRTEDIKNNYPVEMGSVFFRNVDFLVKTNALDQIRVPLRDWLKECRRQKVSLLEIELGFTQLISYLLSFCIDRNRLRLESGIMMDKSSRNVGDYDSLLNNYMEIVDCIKNDTQPEPPVMGSKESFAHITDFVKQHVAEEISIPMLCDQFCISQSYLNKLFHRFEEMSVIEYIRKQRVHISIEIMEKSPHIPLKEISRIVGYEDSSYFSRVFKSQTGYSPRQYLEQKN